MNRTYLISLHLPKMKKFIAALTASLTLLPAAGQDAGNAWERAGHGIHWKVEAEAVVSDHATPLWQQANRFGVSGTTESFGYLRAAVVRDAAQDSLHRWRLGFGADVAGGTGLNGSRFIPAQLYAEVEFLRMRLSAGIKERPAAFRDHRLSSGAMTLGTNARPVPQVRFEVPEYLSITGPSNWAAIKGHVGYGMMTDGNWQEDYLNPGLHYAKHTLYHSKAGYLRVGNPDRFPWLFEGGLEMACQFGGTIWNPVGREGVFGEKLEMPKGPKAFLDALLGTGSDATDAGYANAAGNTLGSWLFALSYVGKDWRARVYYDHFFEDHSMMFLQYGWRDGLIGVEFTLPENPFCTTFVYEHLQTKYQSGPVYHDHNATLPDQISGIDNYYNHNLYQGWQHWGQGIGNPLIPSPLYHPDGRLAFTANRNTAHHLGFSGQPAPAWSYRLLASFVKSWGTYALPFPEVRKSCSLLLEATCALPDWGKHEFAKGWSVRASFGMDRGSLLGDNLGLGISIAKSGMLRR